MRMPIRVHVVTGGAGGVGRRIAEHLLAEGHGVVVVDRRPADWLDEPRGVVIVGDAGDGGLLEEAIARGRDLGGDLHGWVNNAAVFDDGRLDELGTEAVLASIEANLSPVVAGCEAAVREFRRADVPGSIVNVSSHQAQRAVRGALPYATAKAAIEGLTRAVAVDYGADGIRCNTVALGSIATDRSDAWLASLAPVRREAVEREFAELHPLGRLGEAVEVARAVAFLLSDASSFVSGAVLPVDGGRAARGGDPEAR